MAILKFILKGTVLSFAAVVIMLMRGVGPLTIAYVALSLADIMAVAPH